MSNDKYRGEPQNMAFMINAMQQQFERLNMVLEEFSEMMDRHETVITNLRRGQPSGNEVESGSEVDYESKIEVGR